MKHGATVRSTVGKLLATCPDCKWVREFPRTDRGGVNAMRAAKAHRSRMFVSWMPIVNPPAHWSADGFTLDTALRDPAAWGASKVHRYDGDARGGTALCGAAVPPNDPDRYTYWTSTESADDHPTDECTKCAAAAAKEG